MDYTIAANTAAVGSGAAAPTTGTPGDFQAGNPATNTPATTLPAYQMNAIVTEIMKAITGWGLTADRTNNGQLFAVTKRAGGAAEYTVATLPSGSAAWAGMRAYVTDATSPTFLGTLTGGGTAFTPVVYDGTTWIAG